MTTRTKTAVAAVVTVAALAAHAPGQAPAATPAVTAHVAVDASSDLGPLNNPAGYHNQAGTLGPGDQTRVGELAPRLTRSWATPASYYDTATGTYTFRNDAQIDQVAEYSDALMLNFDECDPELMTP